MRCESGHCGEAESRLIVVVPYTRRPAWGWRESRGVPWPVHYVDVSGGEDAYWRLLASLWSRGGDFLVVEHDVVPTVEALRDLVDCPKRWCAQPYPYVGGVQHGLACTKFTAAAIKAVPDLWTVVAGMSDHLHGPKHWCRLDGWSNRVLTSRGVIRCDHHVEVWHEHAVTSHGCEILHAGAQPLVGAH